MIALAALKTLLLPPGLHLLLLVLGIVLVWRGLRRSGLTVLIAATLTLYLMATGAVAQKLAGWLERFPAIPAAQLNAGQLAQLRQAQAIVVLGGGRRRAPDIDGGVTLSDAALERVRHAAMLARATGLPVLVSGGRGAEPAGQAPEAVLMARVLHDEFGISVRWQENDSRTTQQNAANSARLLQTDNGIFRIILVTQAHHMLRAVREFHHAGFSVLPAPAAPFSLLHPAGFFAWLPDMRCYRYSTQVLHEGLGLLAQWLAGREV